MRIADSPDERTIRNIVGRPSEPATTKGTDARKRSPSGSAFGLTASSGMSMSSGFRVDQHARSPLLRRLLYLRENRTGQRLRVLRGLRVIERLRGLFGHLPARGGLGVGLPERRSSEALLEVAGVGIAE